MHGITPYGLQLKKSAQIETTSPYFPMKWLNILYEAERVYLNDDLYSVMINLHIYIYIYIYVYIYIYKYK